MRKTCGHCGRDHAAQMPFLSGQGSPAPSAAAPPGGPYPVQVRNTAPRASEISDACTGWGWRDAGLLFGRHWAQDWAPQVVGLDYIPCRALHRTVEALLSGLQRVKAWRRSSYVSDRRTMGVHCSCVSCVGAEKSAVEGKIKPRGQCLPPEAMLELKSMSAIALCPALN